MTSPVLQVVPLTPDRLDKIARVTLDMERAYFSPGSVAYCLLADGEPVLAGGVVNLLWHRGEAWLLATDWFRAHVKWCLRHMFRAIPLAAVQGGFRRIQATCPTSQSITLFIHLGFHYEGVMSRFGPNGETCFMYARIFD